MVNEFKLTRFFIHQTFFLFERSIYGAGFMFCLVFLLVISEVLVFVYLITWLGYLWVSLPSCISAVIADVMFSFNESCYSTFLNLALYLSTFVIVIICIIRILLVNFSLLKSLLSLLDYLYVVVFFSLLFLSIQYIEMTLSSTCFWDSAYSSVLLTLLWVHWSHVLIGLCLVILILSWVEDA